MQKKDGFSSKLGFVLAAAGSAVGLGNIWRFPYLAAKYGGGIFLLVYIILAVTFGFALMTAEIALGRKTGLSVVGAFTKLNRKFSFLGYLAAFVPAIILPYYSVIGGWVTKYLVAFCQGMQKGAPIDSNVCPEPWDMPGYDSQVIMSAGAFTGGSSIELSSDAPLREPFAVWMQGSLNFDSGKVGVMLAAQEIYKRGLLK